MKKVLITGKGSYIGTSFIKWVEEKYPGEFEIDELDMKKDSWENLKFSDYDAILHVAGIAHQKERKKREELYYSVNCNLAIKTAQKAKKEGVKHFVFLSSMSIYGKNVGIIKRKEIPMPKTYYGKSKWEAEKVIAGMQNAEFNVAILRPPMVYGKNCRGNYQLLKRFILKFPVFPLFENSRSMIKIDNLVEDIRHIIFYKKSGIFFPQNSDFMSTVDLVREIASEENKNVKFVKVFNIFIRIGLFLHISIVEKVFGDLIYER